MIRALLFLALALVSPAAAQDTRDAADALIRRIRALQDPDGTYGGDLVTTCRVLDALGRSPRRYTEWDGPFFRKAAMRIAAGGSVLPDDALAVLALAGCLSVPLTQARRDALERVLAAPGPASYERLLVHLVYDPAGPRPDAEDASDTALRCLTAEDPATVAAPPVDDVAAWARWARAARLRGLVPGPRPVLPDLAADASLDELLTGLETVIALHGLPAADPAGLAALAPDGGDGAPPLPGRVPPGQDLTAALERALAFLEAQQTGGTFGLGLPGWSGPEPGITALNLAAACWTADALERERPQWIGTGLDYLVGLQKADGAIAQHGLDVYTTSVAIEALRAGERPADGAVIERARQYLVAAQADEGEGYSIEDDPHYGGIGYGSDERPDLSNTQIALEALAAAGEPSDAAVYRKALIFLERCQNLGERSVQEWPRVGGGRVVSGTDGGATYMPGNSPAGESGVGPDTYVARSYGSMTYGLVKSYLFCDVPLADPRVVAAVTWLGLNFSVERNPGFKNEADGAQGLYYYYVAMARTLRMLPPEGLRDASGRPIAWRPALRRKLLDEQRTDGSWINEESPRWWEGAPTLCTAYALLALQAVETTSP